MADITVEALAYNLSFLTSNRGLVWVDKDIGYAIFMDNSLQLVYRKTVDGGDNWSAATVISTASLTSFDIWFDKWTPGNNGTKIRIFWLESTTDDVHYRSLDTSSDTLDSDVVVFLGVTFSTALSRTGKSISGAIAGNGDLYVQFWGDLNGERGFYRSQDDGATWFGRKDGADGDAPDEVILMAADNNSGNMVMIYWDRSADELNLKRYFFAANSWTTTLISSGMIDDGDPTIQMSAMIRHSDKHIIVVAWSEFNTATADLRVWDIETGTPTITAKTNIITDKDGIVCCGLLIDQNNNDLYVAYLGHEDSSEVYEVDLRTFYKKSTDGGGTWGSQVQITEAIGDDMKVIDGGTSTPGILEGKWEPVWFNDDLNDLIVNKVNSVDLLAVVGSGGGSHQSSGRGIHRGVLRGMA